MIDVSGVYRLELKRNGRRTPLGLVRLQDGEVSGVDLRNISYAGSYRLEGERNDIVVDGTISVPPNTRLGGDAVSGPQATEAPLALRLPLAAAQGGVVEVAADLDSLHSDPGTRLGPVRARFERVGDA